MYNEEDLLRASESRNLTHIPFQDFTPGSVTALVGWNVIDSIFQTPNTKQQYV